VARRWVNIEQHDAVMATASATREIAAPPARVFELLTDLARMGEWSPENVGGRWLDDATGPAVGARFAGRNRNGWRSWRTTSRVVEYAPPTRFAFDVTAAWLKVSTWEYDVEPSVAGCRVTETWTDRRPALFAKLGQLATGVPDRTAFNQRSIETTLERLEATATAAT
jgi:uncharacterized protein YndB with AHSA1/START domain